MNIVPIGAFLRSKKRNNQEILDTIIHELTHHDQNQLVKNKVKKKIQNTDISTAVDNDVSLLTINQLHYVQSGLTNNKNYKKQPLEREAFSSGEDLSKKLTKYLNNQEKIKKNKDIVIEHIPGNNKNLENKFESNSNLGEIPLLYGTKLGRKE